MTGIVIIMIVAASIFGFQSSCSQRNAANDRVSEIFNVDGKVELLFFYKKDSSMEARDHFYKNVLNKQVEGGHLPRDGVQALFGIDRNGYEGFGITFRPEAAEEQREDIKKRLKESPIIYKVYENVVPNQIKDL
jgi:hypothetical protein